VTQMARALLPSLQDLQPKIRCLCLSGISIVTGIPPYYYGQGCWDDWIGFGEGAISELGRPLIELKLLWLMT
jgi:hypothetical protein